MSDCRQKLGLLNSDTNLNLLPRIIRELNKSFDVDKLPFNFLPHTHLIFIPFIFALPYFLYGGIGTIGDHEPDKNIYPRGNITTDDNQVQIR